jgi:hypothetical protein
MRTRYFPLIVLSCGIVISSPANSNEWPATAFQVVAREPTPEEIALNAGDVSFVDQALSLISEVSNTQTPATLHASGWFTGMGGAYRRAGHLPPALGPIVESGRTQKYRVYIFPYDGSRTRDSVASSGGTYEFNTCIQNNRVPWLSINYDLGAGRLPKDQYSTVGHELMHALMYGDRILDQCNGNSFEVSEGIPDGASLYLMDRKYPGYIGRISISNSAVGLRSYKLPFFIFKDVPTSAKSRLEIITGYGSSSFWRFIAERFGGLKVFPHFLESPIKRGASRKDMYKWLDERLQTLPGLKPPANRSAGEPPGLYEVYPAFISEFASYGGSRYLKFNWRQFRSAKQARNAWLRKAFGGCKHVTLTPAMKEQSIPLEIPENAAQCIHIHYQGFSGNVTSKIEILGDRLAMLDALHLGWAWRIGPDKTENCYQKRKSLNSKWPPCVYKAFSQTGPQIGHYARTWPVDSMDFGEGGGGKAERIYILSNVAVKPEKTQAARNLIVKVAVSDSTMNGKPAEPLEPLSVPRKNQKAPNPMKTIGKEELYGLQTDPPAPETGLKGFSLNTYTPNRSNGARAKAGGYQVAIHKMEYDKTGPVTGLVVKKRQNPESQSVEPSSLFCRGQGTRPIGNVTQSDENAVHITVDTDLCRAPTPTGPCGENGCPVVDHLSAEVSIAFGWRSFGETAPTDIRTPGVQRYINTMPDSLQEAMNFGADTALPDYDDFSATSSSSDGNDTGTGTSSSSGGALDSCACSCEELAGFENRSEEAKKVGDNDATMALAGKMMACVSQCQREYMICRVEADEAEKQKQALLRKQEADARVKNCDCSCQALDDTTSRVQELQKQVAAGGSISNEEIAQLVQCASTCQQEMLACAMNK